ncbi:MAG: hypothetical protein ABSC54_00825 [Smithellaceae bacterium]
MKKLRLNIFAVFMALIFAAVMAMPAQAALRWTNKFVRFTAVAGETLATGNVVTIKNSDGLVYKANAASGTLRPAVGVIDKGGAAGASVEIVGYGILEGNSSLTISGAGYLSGTTAGAITQSSPAYSQQIGYAISTTAYLINCRNYLDTTALTTLGTLTGATPLVFDGATVDSYTTTLNIVDPTSPSKNVYLPNKTGYLRVATQPTTAATVLTPGAAVALNVATSTLFSLTPNDGEAEEITFSGAGAVGDEVTIILVSSTSSTEAITFNATLVSSTGALTVSATAARYYVIKFISNGTHWFELTRTAVQT